MISIFARQLSNLFHLLWMKNHNRFLRQVSRWQLVRTFLEQLFTIGHYRRIITSTKIQPRPDGNFDVSFLNTSLVWMAGAKTDQIRNMIVETYWPAHPHNYERFGTTVAADDIVLDCGACEGLFTLKVGRQVKKVYAFEPSPLGLRVLRENCQSLMADGRVEIIDKFLGDQAGQISFYDDPVNPALSRMSSESVQGQKLISVPMITIDDFARQHPGERFSYLKADVEGAEMKLLRGARQTIAIHKPKIAITTYHDPDHANQIVDFVLSCNPQYAHRVVGAADIDGGAFRPVMAHFWMRH